MKEKRKDGWYEYISTVTGISISEIQELIVKMYSTTGRFSGKQEILDRISQTQSMMFPMYWRNVNKAFFQEMAPKGDWLTQEYINKQTPEDQRELTILNTTIQRITKKSGLTRAKLLRNIGEKDKNYLYWMDWLFRDLNSKKDGKYSDGAGPRQKGSS